MPPLPRGFPEYIETRFRKCIPKEQHTKRLKQNTVPNTPTAEVLQADDIIAFLGQEFALKVDKRLRPLSQHHSLPYGQILSTKIFMADVMTELFGSTFRKFSKRRQTQCQPSGKLLTKSNSPRVVATGFCFSRGPLHK